MQLTRLSRENGRNSRIWRTMARIHNRINHHNQQTLCANKLISGQTELTTFSLHTISYLSDQRWWNDRKNDWKTNRKATHREKQSVPQSNERALLFLWLLKRTSCYFSASVVAWSAEESDSVIDLIRLFGSFPSLGQFLWSQTHYEQMRLVNDHHGSANAGLSICEAKGKTKNKPITITR